MILLNGRGQLGEYLANNYTKKYPIEVYHTWNFIDKQHKTQQKEFNKYKHFLEHKHDSKNKVVFISTASTDKNSYTEFKWAAEKITQELSSYLIIRLPNLVGKGFLNRLVSGEHCYNGKINYITIEEACNFIYFNSINNSNTILIPTYDTIKVSTLKSIILYIRNELKK